MRTERRRLEAALARLSPEDMLIPGVVNQSSVKDIIAHIMEWEAMFFPWYEASLRGETPEVPGPGLTWKDLDGINQRIYEKHCARPLEEILADFRAVHQRLEDTVNAMNPDQRATPGYFTFTCGGSVIDWMNAYAAHDMWAKKKILAWLKKRQPAVIGFVGQGDRVLAASPAVQPDTLLCWHRNMSHRYGGANHSPRSASRTSHLKPSS